MSPKQARIQKSKQVDETKDFSPKQVFGMIPGLDRDMLRWWTYQGWVKPRLRKVGKKSVHFYPEEEIPKIRRMWELVQEGYAPRRAHELVQQQEVAEPRIARKEVTLRPAESVGPAVAAASLTSQFLKENYSEELPLFEFFWESTKDHAAMLEPAILRKGDFTQIASTMGLAPRAHRFSISSQVFLSMLILLSADLGHLETGDVERIRAAFQRMISEIVTDKKLLHEVVLFASEKLRPLLEQSEGT